MRLGIDACVLSAASTTGRWRFCEQNPKRARVSEQWRGVNPLRQRRVCSQFLFMSLKRKPRIKDPLDTAIREFVRLAFLKGYERGWHCYGPPYGKLARKEAEKFISNQSRLK